MSITVENIPFQPDKEVRDGYIISPIFNKEKLHLSLIIPTYNESKNIGKIIKRLNELLEPLIPQKYELIVVDDDSPDRTWEIAQSLVQTYPNLHVIRRQQQRGLATAVLCGWNHASGKILGVIDGDLQHPPETLLQLLQAIEGEVDLAVASRHIGKGGVSDWSIFRRILSRGAQILGLIVLPDVVGRVSDPMSGYFLVRRNAISECHLNPIGYKILVEVLAHGRISKIAEVEYVFQERQRGESKVNSKNYFDYLHHLLRLRLSYSNFFHWKHNVSFPVKRFIRFGLVGLSGVGIDAGMLYILHDPSMLNWRLNHSKIIAAEIAILNNFIWNDFWTFRDTSSKQYDWQQFCLRAVKFNFICLIGLFLNVLILNILSNRLAINYLIADLVAIAIVTFWNFWLNLKLNWRVTKLNQTSLAQIGNDDQIINISKEKITSTINGSS
jgi:dolichol-phosphate mannosyltransferase